MAHLIAETYFSIYANVRENCLFVFTFLFTIFKWQQIRNDEQENERKENKQQELGRIYAKTSKYMYARHKRVRGREEQTASAATVTEKRMKEMCLM